MSKLRLCGVVLVVVSLACSMRAQTGVTSYNPVVTGAPILTITPDARSAGMGEVGLTTSADAYALYHNISKLAFVDKTWGISFGYTPWLTEVAKDISLSTLAGYYGWGNTGEINHAVAASIRYFHIGQTQAFQREMLLPLTIMPYELALDAGYSIALNKHWGLGVSMRYLKSDYNYSVNEVKGRVDKLLMDVSATYQTQLRLGEEMRGDLRAAIAVNNVGGKMSYDGGKSYLFAPAILRLGVGMDVLATPEHKVGLHIEANKVMAPTLTATDRIKPEGYYAMSMWKAMGVSFGDAEGGASEELREVVWSLGAEYSYDNKLFGRIGYHHQDKSKGTNGGMTLGGGFVYEWAKVDISYFIATQANSPLNNTFRLSLGVNF
ncbi:type IX secretion system outer membrane channel protein PorV [Porphyromonas levii]|uniref:Type IX secretion system outer membrane channel protein PorV n=1 Tax=Porphyromonas levii TaxID=28114 RepID=A0A4Y8WQ06_9PORP|nr:type IX secretion system outer membrane channel protein PorV [Porphyromonas levii]TFH95819.1 type IX secretion system outer membrane channel protein PorV [Porphyromonas levii]TFH97724.1 type IX secretion system outer membrane channel protein PorV [Porphyromonas levii]